MRNHWKIIRMLYSPRLIPEFLLILELILVIQILAVSTPTASYYRSQMQLVDSCWKNGNYIYYTPLNSMYSLDTLPLNELLENHHEVQKFYQGSMNNEAAWLEETALVDDTGAPLSITLVHYNSSMREKASRILELSEDIDSKNSAFLFVTPEIAKVYPPGTTLNLKITDTPVNVRDVFREVHDVSFTVCGIIKQEQVPVTNLAQEGYMMAECLTVNSREMADERQILMIVCGEEEIPVNGTMLELTPGTDADRLASVLNEQYVNYGKFYTYAYMRSYSKANLLWVKTNLLLQAFLLLLVFFSHFVGYLSVSTRNKMRTNALLSVNGLTPVQLAEYNTCSVLLLLLVSLVIGLPLVPFTEKWAKVVAYGGHGVMRDCLAVLCVFVLLLVYFTVRTRLKKGNTILLYRKGM